MYSAGDVRARDRRIEELEEALREMYKMNYNRYVVCRSMDGKGGADLICPVHGQGSASCETVVTAPVDELKEAAKRIEELEAENAELKRSSLAFAELHAKLAAENEDLQQAVWELQDVIDVMDLADE